MIPQLIKKSNNQEVVTTTSQPIERLKKEHQLILAPTLDTKNIVASHLSLRSKGRMPRERAWARERKRRGGVGHNKGGGMDEGRCHMKRGRTKVL